MINRMFGGPDQVVEINESVLLGRKYNRDEAPDEQWVFGLYDWQTNVGVIKFVSRRDDTLIQLIQRF